MSELVDFLLARIEEDEAVATSASSAPWMRVAHHVYAPLPAHSRPSVANTGWGDRSMAAPNADHIARHDPARVLRECETKRRVVAAHRDVIGDIETTHPCDGTLGVIECDTLRALASVYSDHPDFREGWRS